MYLRVSPRRNTHKVQGTGFVVFVLVAVSFGVHFLFLSLS